MSDRLKPASAEELARRVPAKPTPKKATPKKGD